jgi:hypothetical protein
MEVLLVGQADSIFFENYTKTIKSYRPDINFDVFSVDKVIGKYDLSACNDVYFNTWEESTFKYIKGLRGIIYPIYTWFLLFYFLKKKKKIYDIIHFKWLIPGVILFPNGINKYAKKKVATFWGGEFESQKLLFSKVIYINFLKRFLKNIDSVTYSTKEQSEIISKLGVKKNKLNFAIYGSSIYKEIEKLTQNETKEDCKKYWNVSTGKITISIGYSGKTVHQHIQIFETLFKCKNFLERVNDYVFILPFTHGGTKEYYSYIIEQLENVNANYLLLSEKMSDADVARLRYATDIMLQLSIFDGRSASIIESLLAGSILISGKWLPYQVFHDKKINFLELDLIDSSLPKMILNITENIQNELLYYKENKTKWGFETWERVIPNWIKIYDKVINYPN